MKISIMQPYLFPYIGYFQLIDVADTFVVYNDVNYIKRGWVNRNRLLLAGKPHTFVIPVVKASQNRFFNEHEFHPHEQWKDSFLKTIKQAYSKSPYFDSALDVIHSALSSESLNLSDFIVHSIKVICDYVAIDSRIVPSSEKHKETISLKGQNRIIEITKNECGTEYINAIGGRELYAAQTFLEQKIKLSFIETEEILYNQLSDDFYPNLSIIDVMMNCSPNEIKRILNQYRLIDGK